MLRITSWSLGLVSLVSAVTSSIPARGAVEDPLELGSDSREHHVEVRFWDTGHGLPQNSVNAMAEGPRGFLWLGTFGGLARFDGVTFKTYAVEQGLTDPRVTALAFDAEGQLWLGHQAGRVSRFDPDREVFEPEGPLPGLAEDYVRHLVVLGTTLCAGSNAGTACKKAGEPWVALPHEQLIDLPDDARGTWPAHRVLRPGLALQSPPVGITRPLDGEWLVSGGTLYLLTRSGLRPVAHLGHARHVVGPVETTDGTVAIGAGRTVYLLPNARAYTDAPDRGREALRYLPVGREIRVLYPAERGSLWVGTPGRGLLRLKTSTYLPWSMRRELTSGAKGVLPHPERGLWILETCGGVKHFVGRERVRTQFENECLKAMAWHPRTETLLAVDARQLFTWREEEGEGTLPLSLEPHERLSIIITTDAGEVWIGTSSGVLFHRSVESEDFVRVATPLNHMRISALSMAPSGELWVGGHGAIARRKPDGSWRKLAESEGVPPGYVRAFAFTDELAWIGTYGGGLARIGPSFTARYGRAQGLADIFIAHIQPDGAGHLWFNSNRGAFVTSLEDLEAVAHGERRRVRARLFPTGESENGAPTGLLMHGVLHLPTIEGLAAIDTRAIGEEPQPLRVAIESATLDGHTLLDDGRRPLPPGPGRLHVRFTTPSFDWPQLTSFEYRLDGGPWYPTQEHELVVERLPPGPHQLELRTIGAASRPGPRTRLRFRLGATFPERLEVKLLAALAILGLTLAIHRGRTHLLARHSRRLESEVEQRRKAEVALSERESHYRQLFESSSQGLVLENGVGQIADLNPAACALFRAEREELLSYPVAELFDSSDVSARDRATLVRRDGTRFEGRVVRRALETGESRTWLHTILDLDPVLAVERKESEMAAKLAKGQRLEAVGRLAGGVAHDVNNMLTVVQGQAQLALDALEDDDGDEVRICLKDILQSSERTGNVTRQLLALGRRRSVPNSEIDLALVLREMRSMLSHLTPETATLEWAVPDAPIVVRADRAQLEQLVVNLVINATQALPPSGGTIWIVLALQGDHANLSVEDDGKGMSPEVQERIFEPFFSTKPEGENSGLGLAVAHATVINAGGRCEVTSVEGAGTRFDVILPVQQTAGVPSSSRSEPLPLREPRSERVLYCEDEAPVRKTTLRILESAGYRVTAVETPQEALVAHREAIQPYDLLVTDVIMPEMNGRELAQAARNRQPGLRVLFVSGYASNLVGTLAPGEAFLAKPYRARALLEEMRALLAETDVTEDLDPAPQPQV
ncbi:MAG: ATP-binding protein [Myxococcota bacterium]